MVLLLMGCSHLTPPDAMKPPAAAASTQSCEAKVVRAMTSPNRVVPGAYACIDTSDPSFESALSQYGITSDAGLAAYAASPPAYTSAAPCPKQPQDYRIYELTGGSDHQAMRLHLTAAGRVDQINFAGMQTSCSDVGAA